MLSFMTILRNTCKLYNLTPLKMKKIIETNSITKPEELVTYMCDKQGMVMSQQRAQYILIHKEFLLPIR